MKQNHECTELKNIRYKTMLLNGNSTDIAPPTEYSEPTNIEDILDRERERERKEPWNRLDKTAKVQKLLMYADVIASREKLSRQDKLSLRTQLIAYLDKKLLQRNKDVTYNKVEGLITDIPALEWTSSPKRFTLRRSCKQSIQRPTKTRKKADKIDSNNKD